MDGDVLNEEQFRELLKNFQTDGFRGLVRTWEGSVAEDYAALLHHLPRAADDADHHRVRGHAHRIKSGSLTIGALRVAEAARRIEEAAKAGRSRDAATDLDPLRMEIITFLRTIRARLGPP